MAISARQNVNVMLFNWSLSLDCFSFSVWFLVLKPLSNMQNKMFLFYYFCQVPKV